ncbi:MAG: TRAM domain-containing protein [Candidatus Binatia bacterium]
MAEAGGPEPFVVTTGEMAYGPHAVARAGGKVVFVRGAAPHEEVEVRVREERERYAFADLVAVRRPSPVRRSAPCPYLPRCGGCPWQHLEYGAQLAAKQRIVGDQLQRLGGVVVPVAAPLPSPRQLAYRRRVKLRVADGAVGFLAAASHDVVPIAHCLLAEPGVDAAIAWLAGLVHALRSAVRRLEVAAGAAADRIVVAGEVEGAWHDGDEAACRDWLATHPEVAGLCCAGAGGRGRGATRRSRSMWTTARRCGCARRPSPRSTPPPTASWWSRSCGAWRRGPACACWTCTPVPATCRCRCAGAARSSPPSSRIAARRPRRAPTPPPSPGRRCACLPCRPNAPSGNSPTPASATTRSCSTCPQRRRRLRRVAAAAARAAPGLRLLRSRHTGARPAPPRRRVSR